MRLYGYSGIFIAANTWGIDHPYNVDQDETLRIHPQSEEVAFSGKSAILNQNKCKKTCSPKEEMVLYIQTFRLQLKAFVFDCVIPTKIFEIVFNLSRKASIAFNSAVFFALSA